MYCPTISQGTNIHDIIQPKIPGIRLLIIPILFTEEIATVTEIKIQIEATNINKGPTIGIPVNTIKIPGLYAMPIVLIDFLKSSFPSPQYEHNTFDT